MFRDMERQDSSRIGFDWTATQAQASEASRRCIPGPRGLYSIRPDQFPGSYNCVTWVVETVNVSLGQAQTLPNHPAGNITILEKHIKTLQHDES